MEKQFRCTQFRTIPRDSAQFPEYLIASIFAIIAQLSTMKWHKRKQSLHTISYNSKQQNSDWKPQSKIVNDKCTVFISFQFKEYKSDCNCYICILKNVRHNIRVKLFIIFIIYPSKFKN